MIQESEKHIIGSLKKKNYTFALKEIMEVYHETLYWQIRKLVLVHEDADDVLQNTYIKIFKGLPNFKQKSSVKTWTYRIAYNESMRHLEKEGKRGLVVSEEATQHYWSKLSSDPYFDAAACEKQLHQFMAVLPERKRQIFVMKYFDGLTFEEIGNLLKTSPNTIKTTYYALKKQMEESIKRAI